MESLLRVGLSNALAASVLALIVAVAAQFCRRRPALVHGLWLVVLLKLVTPPLATLELAWPSVLVTTTDETVVNALSMSNHHTPLPGVIDPGSGVSTAGSAAPSGTGAGISTGEPARARVRVSEPSPELGSARPADIEPDTHDQTQAGGATAFGRAASAATVPSLGTEIVGAFQSHWQFIGCALWLTGSILWTALSLRRIGRFARLLGQAMPAPDALQRRADELSRRLGLVQAPRVWLLPGPISPLLWALGTSPRLLVPEALWARLGDDQRDALLIHELSHLRRHDHWVRWLELIVGALYWWLPIAWWARRALRESEEQCCDAWVVWALPDSSRSYATALVEAVEFLAQGRAATPIGASGLGQFQHLSRRIAMIMKGTTPRNLSWAGLLGLIALAALLLPWMPSLAQHPTASDVVIGHGAPLSPTGVSAIEGAELSPDGSDDQDRADQLADARDEIELLEVQLESKQSALRVASAQVERDQRSLERAKTLVEKGATSQEAFDRIQADAEASQAQMSTRQAELREIEVKLRIAKRRLARLEQQSVRRSAPFQGMGAGGFAPGMPGAGGPGAPGMPGGAGAAGSGMMRMMMGGAGPGGAQEAGPKPAGPGAAPSVQAKAQDLKQIGLALHNYHDAFGTFPPAAITGTDGQPLLSWRVAILPFLDQNELFQQFHLDEPWDSEHNKALLSRMPSVFGAEDTAAENHLTHDQAIVGPSAAFEGNVGLPISEFTDGTSNTIIVAHAPNAVPWTKPEELKLTNSPAGHAAPSLPKLRSEFLVLFADGSVRHFAKRPSDPVLRALFTRNGGEVIAADASTGERVPRDSNQGAIAAMAAMMGSGGPTPPLTPGMVGRPPGDASGAEVQGDSRTGARLGRMRAGGMGGAPGMGSGGTMSGAAGMPGAGRGMASGPGTGGGAGGAPGGRGTMSGAMGGAAGMPGMGGGGGHGGRMSTGGIAGMGGGAGTPRDPEQRLAELEAKMDRILKEIEGLRKEQPPGGSPRAALSDAAALERESTPVSARRSRGVTFRSGQ